MTLNKSTESESSGCLCLLGQCGNRKSTFTAKNGNAWHSSYLSSNHCPLLLWVQKTQGP